MNKFPSRNIFQRCHGSWRVRWKPKQVVLGGTKYVAVIMSLKRTTIPFLDYCLSIALDFTGSYKTPRCDKKSCTH